MCALRTRRRAGVLAGIVAAVVAASAAGCSGAPGAGPPAPAAAPVLTADPCSLLTTAEVTALLGTAPRLPATSHSPFPDVQVVCGWQAADPHRAADHLILTATVRTTSFDVGPAKAPGAVTVSGLGEKAVYVPPGSISTVAGGVLLTLATTGAPAAATTREAMSGDAAAVLHRMGR